MGTSPLSAKVLFWDRNMRKVGEGQGDRAPAVVAQTASLVHQISALDNSLGKTTKVAVDAIGKTSAGAALTKGLQFSGNLVNPLLAFAAVDRVLKSDDKEATGYKEAGAMTGMFGAEALMKRKDVSRLVTDTSDDVMEAGIKKISKLVKPLEKSLSKSQNKIVKIGTFILSGIAMVGASIFGYAVGAEVGKEAIDKKRALFKEDNPSSDDIPIDSEIVKEEIAPDKQKLLIES